MEVRKKKTDEYKMNLRTTKPTKWPVRPAKTQISQVIHPVRSVSSLSTWRNLGSLLLSYSLSAQRSLCSDWADSQADLSLRWAHMSFCWCCHAAAKMVSFIRISTRWKRKVMRLMWAMTWQNQQNECAPSEDSDQPGHLPSLVRVFVVRSMGS